MSTQDELYPGLDDELDAAFRRNTNGDLDEGEATTLEEAVKDELGPEPSPESDFQQQLSELHDRLLGTDDPDEFKALLLERTTLIDAELEAQSIEAKETVNKDSENAQHTLAGDGEALAVFTAASSKLSEGPAWASDALELVKKNAATNVVPTISAGLDSTILEQAIAILEKGSAWAVDSIKHVNQFSTPGSIDSMKQALDSTILAQTVDIARKGYQWASDALKHLQQTTPEAQWPIAEAIEYFIFFQAQEISKKGQMWSSDARSHLDNIPSEDIREQAKKVLGL